MDTQEPARVKDAIAAMKGMYEKRSPLEQKGFKGKLRILAMTTKEKSLRQEVEKILEDL